MPAPHDTPIGTPGCFVAGGPADCQKPPIQLGKKKNRGKASKAKTRSMTSLRRAYTVCKTTRAHKRLSFFCIGCGKQWEFCRHSNYFHDPGGLVSASMVVILMSEILPPPAVQRVPGGAVRPRFCIIPQWGRTIKGCTPILPRSKNTFTNTGS